MYGGGLQDDALAMMNALKVSKQPITPSACTDAAGFCSMPWAKQLHHAQGS
jgi:predicted RND superfamily exporter protein